MHIGIYDPYLDDVGGGEKYMLSIAEILSKEHEVSIFWHTEDDIQVAEKRFALDLSRVRLATNIFSSKFSMIGRMLASRKYDAIIVLSDGSIPIVLSKLYIHVQQPLKEFQSHSLKEKLKLSRVSTFFCNSEFTEKFIHSKYHLKTRVIYPPVELHLKKIKKTNTILHVGRFRVKNIDIDDYKKQGVMIEVFKQMVDHGLKGWEFVLAVSVLPRDKDAFGQMEDKAKGYPIKFQINKTNLELWVYYSKAKIYWHASGYGEDLDLHPEYAEHFGISTVEAMGAGAVPVVINAGGQKEIVADGENGLLWSSIPELIEKTLLLINSKSMQEDLSKHAKMRAQDFSKEEFARKVKEMIG